MHRLITRALLAGCLGLLAAACSQNGADNGDAGRLEHIRETGTLRVVTRNAPTSYYLNRHKQAAGPEQALTSAFAAHLGVDVQYIVKDSIRGVLAALEAGKADMAEVSKLVKAALAG